MQSPDTSHHTHTHTYKQTNKHTYLQEGWGTSGAGLEQRARFWHPMPSSVDPHDPFSLERLQLAAAASGRWTRGWLLGQFNRNQACVVRQSCMYCFPHRRKERVTSLFFSFLLDSLIVGSVVCQALSATRIHVPSLVTYMLLPPATSPPCTHPTCLSLSHPLPLPLSSPSLLSASLCPSRQRGPFVHEYRRQGGGV